jgi:tRNA 2-thiouridine synthesizing protein D
MIKKNLMLLVTRLIVKLNAKSYHLMASNMKLVLIIRTNHLSNNHTALQFARAALAQQHTFNCIYFHLDSVLLANRYIDMPTDEFDLNQAWSNFANENNLQLTVCAAAGLRRGINEKCLADGFKMGSIGQLVESCDIADRVLSL